MSMNLDLFGPAPIQLHETPCPGAAVLRGFALPFVADLLSEIETITATAPPHKMHTPSGLPMSVATTSCGSVGWVSDAYGYRYSKRNAHAHAQQNWPVLPDNFLRLAKAAASAAGFANFEPDSCLINTYKVGAKMSLHQDKNEKDFSQPIVSVSLGLPAMFLLGGLKREDVTVRIPLTHGDIVVWGGPARLFFHGILPIKAGIHEQLGAQRINLTFRKAL